jgi:hypothetical protein
VTRAVPGLGSQINQIGLTYLALGKRVQKLKVACRSMRRTATPVENGPP